jgi:hypothetical protein
MMATASLDDRHATLAVTSALEPSLYVPIAVNRMGRPSGTGSGEPGSTAMLSSVTSGGGTTASVRGADLLLHAVTASAATTMAGTRRRCDVLMAIPSPGE